MNPSEVFAGLRVTRYTVQRCRRAALFAAATDAMKPDPKGRRFARIGKTRPVARLKLRLYEIVDPDVAMAEITDGVQVTPRVLRNVRRVAERTHLFLVNLENRVAGIKLLWERGCTKTEIVQQLGISYPAVRTRIAEARLYLHDFPRAGTHWGPA